MASICFYGCGGGGSVLSDPLGSNSAPAEKTKMRVGVQLCSANHALQGAALKAGSPEKIFFILWQLVQATDSQELNVLDPTTNLDSCYGKKMILGGLVGTFGGYANFDYSQREGDLTVLTGQSYYLFSVATDSAENPIYCGLKGQINVLPGVMNEAGTLELYAGSCLTTDQLNGAGMTAGFDQTKLFGCTASIITSFPTLTSLSIVPSAISMAAGATKNLLNIPLIAGYSDHGTLEAKSSSWSIKNGGGTLANGYFTAPASGSAILTCCYSENGNAKTADLTVTVLSGGGANNPGDHKTVSLSNEVSMEFVWIPAGTFYMGNPDGVGEANEHPQHQVTLTQGFWIGKYEVTQAQWQQVMGSNPSYSQGPTLPVESVSWTGCQEFITAINHLGKGTFSLPTEAEWEYACRAGSSSLFYWGDTAEADYCWYDENSQDITHAVGGKLPNAWGVYDIIGNVDEWCQDWYGDYGSSAATDPTGPESGSYRILRGGYWGWGSYHLYSAFRFNISPDFSDNGCGLRLRLQPGT
ncbi:MAG: formylglycine-generating enzyme family protein [Candidatus Wallbacteria bacterium]|nr:formylglycine-generating enzyme family protein [Candidatus Wallbacteria bacterium]